MAFARWVWALLVGIKDALVLLFMILFFALLYAGLKGQPDPVHAGVLHVDLDGVVVEEPASEDLAMALGAGSGVRQWARRDVVMALEAAAKDSRVEAVALDLDGFVGGGQTALGDIGEAIERVKKAGKPVLAYATGYSDDQYQLAAHADEIWLNPMGIVAFAGPGGNNLYFAEVMEKLGITANIYRAGGNDYKSAVEPYTRSDMSPEARENARALAGALLETWEEEVAKARPKAKLRPYLSDPVAALKSSDGDLSKAAVANGLVDTVAPRRAWHEKLAELGGKDERAVGGYKRIALEDYVAAKVDDDAAGHIGLVTVAGTIVDGHGPRGTAAGASIAQAIDEAVAAGWMKALVVRIDSPGGSALASEQIRQSLAAAREAGIPVVASMGNVAASGGYWVATGADAVYAEPSTVTGSIGVFGIFPSFERAMEKIGVGIDGVKTTPLSGEPDLLGGPSEDANTLIQAGVDQTYRRFLALTAEARDMEVARVHQLAGGRVWDGGSARQLGLVDGFGGLDEAVAKAAELAELDDPGVRWIEREKSFSEQLADLLRGDARGGAPDAYAFLKRGPDPVAAAMAAARELMAGPVVQARCLACPVETIAPRPAPASWWARLLG
ncbi:signal peptide peptidase SppA [Sphingomicrobium nitratireducens]|uniref:signal peptide peptidase SppA n=1 Tax=Sphingomicrobium nitratireducens TaxID=2964666 RepID=UPI00223FA84A|nr:signal peptide peptidase SppA [Sphingomicrobium nitratireducens]